VSVALIHHLNRDGSINGSKGLTDFVKQAFIITKDPDQPKARLIKPDKSNIGSDGLCVRFTIEGEGIGTHAEFTRAEDETRARLEAAGLSLEAAESVTEPPEEPRPHRCVRLLVQGGSEPQRAYLGDADSMAGARALAQADEYARGCSLVWVIKRDGMEVAVHRIPGGEVRYAAYELAPEQGAVQPDTKPQAVDGAGEASAVPMQEHINRVLVRT
jgi:hypothetical protein